MWSYLLPFCALLTASVALATEKIATGRELARGRPAPDPQESPRLPEPQRLYHPVKCAADDGLGAAALQWLSWDARCGKAEEDRHRGSCQRELRALQNSTRGR